MYVYVIVNFWHNKIFEHCILCVDVFCTTLEGEREREIEGKLSCVICVYVLNLTRSSSVF